MIRALVWKESREQGLIVGSLAVLGAGVLAALALLGVGEGAGFDSRNALTDPGNLSAIMLTVTAGAVVGGTLFAQEKENGTSLLLAMLPVKRRVVWIGKLIGGLVLVLTVVLVLYAVAAPLGLLGLDRSLWYWAMAMPTLAVATYGWATVGSVVARNSLAAAGLGVLFMAMATFLLTPLLWVVYVAIVPWLRAVLPEAARDPTAVIFAFALLFSLLVLPFVISLRLYTAPDRDRNRRVVRGKAGGSGRPPRESLFAPLARLTAGFRAAVWMNLRQQSRFCVVLSVMGVFCGLSLMAPQVPFMLTWPPMSLVLAVLVGVLGWYDEQSSGAKRFWLERRLPTGQLWWAKVLVGSVSCLIVSVVSVVPVAVKAWVVRREWDELPSFLLGEYGFPVFTFLVLWPVYGYAVGHLVGILFRKTVVAGAVAMMVAAVVSVVWLPSLVGGGVWAWQVWLPLLPILATARVLVWSCVADRVGSLRALCRLATAAGVLALTVAASLLFRVIEIPNSLARDADEVFKRDEIPPFETNLSGQEYRRAGTLLHEAVFGQGALTVQIAERRVATPVSYSRDADSLDRMPKPLVDLLARTLEHGWQPSEEHDRLLAEAFSTPWLQSVEAAATLPLGTVEDPRDLTLNSPLRHLQALTGADALLLAHGLQAQHNGDPGQFVTDFALVLNLSRNVRNKSIQACAEAGRDIERRAVQGLERWLERLRGRDDLLTEIAELMAEHDAMCGPDLADIRLADQVVLRNSFRQSGEVLQRQWQYSTLNEDAQTRLNAEADLIGVSWQMPWEKERHERLIALGNQRGYTLSRRESPFDGLPAIGWSPHVQSQWYSSRNGFEQAEHTTQAARRAARILVAVRRFELKHGNPPAKLSDLVPDLIPAVPLDPFDQLPFRYRLSAGEQVTLQTRTRPPVTALPLTEFGNALLSIGGALSVVGDDPYVTLQQPIGVTVDWLRKVPTGRPIVWSIGPDRFDDGGVRVNERNINSDLVFISPAEPPTTR